MIIAWLQAQAAKLFGGLAAALFLSTVTLFFLNKGKAEDLRETKVELAEAKAAIEALQRQAELFEQAALERLADHEELAEQEEELTDALRIEDPDARRRAFVCAILRQQNGNGGAVPAECGPEQP